MNWISLLSQIFFCVLVTGATGNVMILIWFLCRKFLQEHNPKLVNYMLRWVVVMFLLPITYVAILLNYKAGYVQHMEGVFKMMFVISMDNPFYLGFALIWLIATVVIGVYFLRSEITKYRICRNNFDDGNSLAQIEFERIKGILGIKGRVELLRNDDPKIDSPFVVGMFRRKVVIPYLEYTKEELDVILYHELNHIKKSDVLFRYLTTLAIIMNSINPVSYLLWERVLLWGEADCDARAIDGLKKEGISKKDYYDVIWKLMEAGPAQPTLFYYPMLLSAAKSLYRRMDIMEKYRANMRKITKSVTFVMVMVFALLSSTTAYAAGIGVAEASDAVFKEEQSVEVDKLNFSVNTDWSDEMLVPYDDTVETVYVNDEIMTLGGGSFTWDVPVGTRYVTSSIYFSAGTEVQIACTATPNDATYWFGLMYPTNASSVVEGSGSGNHDFTVPSSGYYRVLVENRSDVVITVRGSYSY